MKSVSQRTPEEVWEVDHNQFKPAVLALPVAYTNAAISRLGPYPSLMFTVGLDPRSEWPNGILENSRYSKLALHFDRKKMQWELKQYSGNKVGKIRKYSTDSVPKMLAKIREIPSLLGGSLNTNPPRGVADEDAAAELILHIVNTSELYGPKSIGASIETNYAKKWRAGTFDREKAEQGYKYLVDAGAKSYVKEHGSRGDKWNEMFNAPTRRLVAQEITQAFVDEAKLGNFRG